MRTPIAIPKDPVGGQRRDPATGLMQPWYTHDALDVLQAIDWSDKTVLEWGGGQSTLWWASRAKRVVTIETHDGWVDWIRANTDPSQVTVLLRSEEEIAAGPTVLMLGASAFTIHPDIVIIDGAARTECLIAALSLPRPLYIVFDNWQQDYVYIDPVAERLMAPYKASERLFPQKDYKLTFEGQRPWQTAIWHLTE